MAADYSEQLWQVKQAAQIYIDRLGTTNKPMPSMKDVISQAYANQRRMMNELMYQPAPMIVSKEEAARLIPAPVAPAFPVDHAWDMLVLAAKASRYE